MDFSNISPVVPLSFLVILFSLSVHECAHAITAYWAGDDTARLLGRITLNPISHIDPIGTIALPVLLAITGMPVFGWARPVPVNPSRLKRDYWMVLVAVAGPISNVLIAIAAAIIMRITIMAGGTDLHDVVFTLGYLFIIINILLAIFNMLPIPPLDGSRVLFHFFINGRPQYYPAWENVERFSFIFLYLIIIMEPTQRAMSWAMELLTSPLLAVSGLHNL